jgi:hypothetical protein
MYDLVSEKIRSTAMFLFTLDELLLLFDRSADINSSPEVLTVRRLTLLLRVNLV